MQGHLTLVSLLISQRHWSGLYKCVAGPTLRAVGMVCLAVCCKLALLELFVFLLSIHLMFYIRIQFIAAYNVLTSVSYPVMILICWDLETQAHFYIKVGGENKK